MNKAWAGILAGCALIIGIMVFLTIRGVTKRAHTYIKWSQVESFSQVGDSVFKRLYPQWENVSSVFVKGPLPQKEKVEKSLAAQLTQSQWTTQVVTEPSGSESLVIEMIPIDTSVSPVGCGDKPRLECLKLKALRSFHKKKRDRAQNWFHMQWVNPNLFYLYFNALATAPQ